MTKIERVKRVCKYLIYKDFAGNDTELAVLLGYTKSSFSQIINEKVPLSEKFIDKLCSVDININKVWIDNGYENMLKDQSKEFNIASEPPEKYIADKFIPLVTVTAIGGFGNSNFSISERDVKQYYVIPKFKDKKIDFMIEVEGSSMYPKYNSGDIVACRIINERGFIQWNKTHVVATKNQGIIIKRIKPGDNDNLLMVSDNKSYDPFSITIDEIDGIALVVGVIRLE